MQQNSEWLTLWTKPRATIRRLIEKNPRKHVLILAIINGVLASFTWFVIMWANSSHDKKLTNPLFLGLLLAIGIIFGLINLYVASFLYKITGQWIGGKGTFTEVKCAVGWSNYPYIISGLFGLFGEFLKAHPLASFPFLLIKFILFVWAFVIFLKVIGEAHLFSAWKALLSLIITFAIVFVAVLAFSLVFAHFAEPFSKKSHAIKVSN